MRTTLTIDDGIVDALKEAAYTSGKPYKQIVNETLRAGIAMKQTAYRAATPYTLKPASLGAVNAGYDLNKSLQLADELEELEIVKKMEMRK